MMTNIQNWVTERSERERLYLFLTGLVITYALFYFIFQRPLIKQKRQSVEQINAITLQQITVRDQIAKIRNAIQDPNLMLLMTQRHKLSMQILDMQRQINVLQPSLMSYQELTMFMQKLLHAQKNSGMLIRLQQLPDTAWPPTTKTEQTPEQSQVSAINQQNIQIEFQNDYYNTITYLQNLERISNKVYWDSFSYRVIAYPKAEVTLNFHLLSMHES